MHGFGTGTAEAGKQGGVELFNRGILPLGEIADQEPAEDREKQRADQVSEEEGQGLAEEAVLRCFCFQLKINSGTAVADGQEHLLHGAAFGGNGGGGKHGAVFTDQGMIQAAVFGKFIHQANRGFTPELGDHDDVRDAAMGGQAVGNQDMGLVVQVPRNECYDFLGDGGQEGFPGREGHAQTILEHIGRVIVIIDTAGIHHGTAAEETEIDGLDIFGSDGGFGKLLLQIPQEQDIGGGE